MLSRRVDVFLIVVISLSGPSGALAQHGGNLDVQSCYSNILVDKSMDWSKTKLRYAMLSLWNKDLYEQAQTSNTLSVMYAGAKVSDTYEHSNEERLRELYLNKESIDYDRETASAKFFLDPQASRILKDCVDAKVRSAYGFSSVYYLDDERTATLELIWNWAPENTPLRIHTSGIRNAVVLDDDGTHAKHLLRMADQTGWETFRGHDKLITLEREDLEKDIVINVETSPDVRASHIVIPAVPKKQDCKPSAENKDAFGQSYQKTLTSSDMNILPRDSDDGHGHKYVHWTINVAETFPDVGKDGIVSGVICRKAGSSLDHYEITTPTGEAVGSSATCKGWFENAGRLITMDVSWFKKGYTCTNIDWIVEPNVSKRTKSL